MHTNKYLSRFVSTGTRLVILAIMLVALFSSSRPAAAAAVSFDLYAVTGTTVLAGQTVTVWGYNSTGAAATQPGGPTLVVNEGDVVTINLINNLSVDTGLLFQGQAMAPDTSGVAAGGNKSYTFTASRPGTYLYGAGFAARSSISNSYGPVRRLDRAPGCRNYQRHQ